MASTPVFSYVGIMLTAILYGIYFVVFALYWRIQLKRSDRWKGILLYPLTASFILCSAYFIISTIQVHFFISFAVLKEMSLLNNTQWMSVVNNSLYTAIDFISQLILLYRCWIMWRKPLVMIVPCILSLMFLGIALVTLSIQIKYYLEIDVLTTPIWYDSAVTTFFFISLGVNTLTTALIVYKIVTVYKEIRGFSDENIATSTTGQRDLYPLISILVESGLITFVGQLAQSIMYKSAPEAFPLIGGPVVMLYGISTTVVLVRVEMGLTYDRNTSKTAYSMNSRRPIPLAQFPSKLSQSITVDVEFQGSDDPYDTRSKSKFISSK